MLTLDSKFADFIALCVKNGACSDKGEAVPVMEKANTGVGMKADGTCAEGFALYRDGKKFPESWASWVLGLSARANRRATRDKTRSSCSEGGWALGKPEARGSMQKRWQTERKSSPCPSFFCPRI